MTMLTSFTNMDVTTVKVKAPYFTTVQEATENRVKKFSPTYTSMSGRIKWIDASTL